MTGRSFRVGLVMTLAMALLQTSSPVGAVFPGENGLILYGRSEYGGSDLRAMSPDGTYQKSFGSSHYAAFPKGGAWSPDATKVAYTTSTFRPTELFVLDYASLEEHPLGISGAGAVEWSPDGKKLVFHQQVTDGNYDIFVTDSLDGSKVTRLSHFSDQPEGDALTPNWSPDGSRIAFSGTVGANRGIWTMNPDGSDPKLIAGGADSSTYSDPDWSPDGRTVIFESDFNGSSQIYTVPKSGGTPTLIETGGAADPAWSPDGQQVAFQRGGDIFTVPLAGGTATLLVSCGGNFSCDSPDWADVPPPPVKGCTPGPDEVCGTSKSDRIAIDEGSASTGGGSDQVLVEPTDDTTEINVDASGGGDKVTVDLTNLSDESAEEPQRSGSEGSSAAQAPPTITVVTGAGNDGINIRGFLPAGWRLFLIGGDGDDLVKGNLNATERAIAGYRFNGGAGRDKLTGSAANDKLSGGAGADKLTAGKGKDVLSGGSGKDTCVFDRGDRLRSCEFKEVRHFD